jgi:hypothetical protein
VADASGNGSGAPAATGRSASESLRRRSRGLVLIAGGAAVALLLEPVGPLALAWLPLLLGASYLLAAVAGGREGALWAPGIVVTVWGLGVLVALGEVGEGRPFGSTTTAALGLGTLLAVAATRVGLRVSALAVAAPVALIGLVFAVQEQGPGALGELAGNGWPYGLALGLWGAWELRP